MTTLNRDVADAIANGVRRGLPFTTAAVLAGVPKPTVSSWLSTANAGATNWPDGHPVSDDTRPVLLYFSNQIAQAREEYLAKAIQRIDEAAQTTGKSGVPEWRAQAWLLEHSPSYKAEFGQQITVEQSGTVDHRLQLVQALPDAELLQLASPEMQALLAPLPANDATNQPDNDPLLLDRGSDSATNHDDRLPQLPQ